MFDASARCVPQDTCKDEGQNCYSRWRRCYSTSADETSPRARQKRIRLTYALGSSCGLSSRENWSKRVQGGRDDAMDGVINSPVTPCQVKPRIGRRGPADGDSTRLDSAQSEDSETEGTRSSATVRTEGGRAEITQPGTAVAPALPVRHHFLNRTAREGETRSRAIQWVDS